MGNLRIQRAYRRRVRLRSAQKRPVGKIDVQRTGSLPFRSGTGEIERPPRPAGRGGKGSSRCPALRGRSRASLPCSASGGGRLPRNITVNYDGGQVAKPRVASVAALTILRRAADRALGPCLASCTSSVRAFPEMSCKGMNGSIALSRWIRLGRDLCTISVHNRDRSASRPAPQDGKETLMRVHGSPRLRRGVSVVPPSRRTEPCRRSEQPRDNVRVRRRSSREPRSSTQVYNLAASRASSSDPDLREKAVHSRDSVAARLTPAQLARAQRLAREWQPRTSTAEPPVHERPSTSAAPAPRTPNAGAKSTWDRIAKFRRT